MPVENRDERDYTSHLEHSDLELHDSLISFCLDISGYFKYMNTVAALLRLLYRAIRKDVSQMLLFIRIFTALRYAAVNAIFSFVIDYLENWFKQYLFR